MRPPGFTWPIDWRTLDVTVGKAKNDWGIALSLTWTPPINGELSLNASLGPFWVSISVLTGDDT